ncbi:hypothetical protein [Amnibacterium endophyticum]|uniref:Uncharacterized protein n=1 Tax=Amnibacterium endophyticum TaxID=2109337 RepID=A0ABW4LFN7_9MICO
MSERPRRDPGPAWLVRAVVVVAVLVVVAALVVTIATGTLFTTPNGR